jgi:1,4-alpha-glucan branching enzyme
LKYTCNVIYPNYGKKTNAIQAAKNESLAADSWYSRFTDFDISLFRSGKHYKLYEKLGSHVVEHAGVKGTYFAVWAPNARQVFVEGNFNGWNKASHPMQVRWDESGIWETFIPGVGSGEVYKYYIQSNSGEGTLRKQIPLH